MGWAMATKKRGGEEDGTARQGTVENESQFSQNSRLLQAILSSSSPGLTGVASPRQCAGGAAWGGLAGAVAAGQPWQQERYRLFVFKQQ
jgi:hypothetical protein